MTAIAVILWIIAGILFFLTLWLSPHAASEIEVADLGEFKRIGSPNPLLNIHQFRWIRYVLGGEYRGRLSDPKPIAVLDACRVAYSLVILLVVVGGVVWILR